ncbi:ABC transporter ATP-binding protein [Actinophytocola sediminis]
MTRPGRILGERWRLLSLLAGTGRWLLALLSVAHLVTALAAGATAVATGWLLDRALAGSGVGDVLVPLGLVAALVLAGQCVEIAREPLDLLAARRIDGALRATVRATVARPREIAHLDDLAFGTDVARISELGGWRTRTPGTGAVGQLVLLGRLTSAVLCAAVLAWFAPLLACWLLVVTLVMRAGIRRHWVRLSATWDTHAGARLRMDYWADTLTESPSAKEVRLFGLGPWLTERYRRQARAWLEEVWRHRRGILRRQWWTFLLALGTGFAALYVPGAALGAGELGFGGLITMVLAAWGVFAAGAMGYEAFDIEYAVGAIRALDRLDRRASTWSAGADSAAPAPETPARIHFERVGFRYPGTDRPVLDGFELAIAPAEVLAVVGRNGAGKTTMIKLLAGLQRPTEGRITLDGVDLAGVDIESWRRRVTAVFQDFVHYPLTVRENVALGAPEVAEDDEAIASAIAAAGATELVDRLPDGLDSLLTREHSGGVDLSGGQWQRIAIARALFAVAHGRQVLVLDEPTAHLDVRAEAEFYDRVIAAVSGVTVVLISHRLSTVRHADRIVVLDRGRISEMGSHGELMDLAGAYAGMYRLQADRFATDPTDGVPV